MTPPPPLPFVGPGREVPVPPFPNLGPEPWPRSWWDYAPLAAGLMVAAAALIVGLAAWRWRRRQTARGARTVSRSGPTSAPVTVRERYVARSAELRAALVERHGGSWGARTTEEIAEALAGLGPVDVDGQSLVEFLHLADLAKFGGEARFAEALEEVERRCGVSDPDAWSAALLAGPAAGTRSMITGR